MFLLGGNSSGGYIIWIEGLGDQAVHFYSRKPLRYTKLYCHGHWRRLVRAAFR